MIFDIRDYGAVADGVTINTLAIQNTIDACHAAGGGRILIEGGTYVTGSITLRSKTELHIASTGILLGSPNLDDYPEKNGLRHVCTEFLPRGRNTSLIFAEECDTIAITGTGVIDCNGKSFTKPKETYAEKGGWKFERIDAPTPPRVVFFTGCSNVKVQDVTMRNQPSGWSYWIHDCDCVSFTRCNILAEVEYPNNDGIHINSSRNVTISDCNIVTGDDCLVIRANNSTLAENKVCEKVTITNCNLTSYAAGIRIGWINDGTIRNCTFSNIVITDTNVGISIMLPGRGETRLPDEGREATHIENLYFSNIVMDRIYNHPVKIAVNEKECTKLDTIRNIRFTGLHSTGLEYFYLKGKKNNHLKDIYFNDCTFVKVSDETLPGYRFHGCKDRRPGAPICYADNVVLNNTSFTVEDDITPVPEKVIRTE